MALQFIFVKVLQYTHTPVFFEAGLRYRIEKKFTITGRLSDNANPAGVASLLSQEKTVLDTAVDYDDIYLNGVFFGNGRIDNINFDGGTLVRSEEYTYEITCYEDGNLYNGSTGVYTGLTWLNPHTIDSLSEDFQFQNDEQGDLHYTHNLSVKLVQTASVPAGLNAAKALASVFFNSTTGLGAYLNSYANIGNAKRLYTESYNVVECSCSFGETVVIPNLRAGNYSYDLNYNLQEGTDGFTTILEKCEIRGLSNPRYAGAVEGLNALMGGAYTRSNTVYAAYNFSDATLFSKPIERKVVTNKFTGDITIETTFSNNPRYQLLATWDYKMEIQRDSLNYYTVTESGSIIGYGRPFLDKYANALAFYTTTVKPGIAARCAALYTKISGRTLSLIEIRQTKAQNEAQGTIEYSATYTDNNLFSNTTIRKTEVTITVAKPVALTQKYNVFNQKEIVQPQNQSTPGTVSYQIRLKGSRGTPISVYLTAAKAIVSANLPVPTDQFIESCQYTFSPEQNGFDLSLQIQYVGVSKAFTDITLD